MRTYQMTNKQARRFMLLKHGLIGPYKFSGKPGALDFVRQVGCIQFDPIDICGRNPELVLQSRVQGFSKTMLDELLYEDRQLIDYFDKNLAIMPADDWKYFARLREAHRQGGRSHEAVNTVCDEIMAIIREKGPVSSADLGFKETVSWYWSDTKLSRAALETLYFRGELVVHHKNRSIKYYDLTDKCLPPSILEEPDPWPDDVDHRQWRVQRRIASVGLLWNRASDAWLFISGLKTFQRQAAFTQLLADGRILEIAVAAIPYPLYCHQADQALLEWVIQNPDLPERCEFLAPLDNLLWDRKLIKALFNFDYKWEIYTPAEQRKYGYYVLPILYGDRLVGRIEAVNDRKTSTLKVSNLWLEDGIQMTHPLKTALDQCIGRLASLNNCRNINL